MVVEETQVAQEAWEPLDIMSQHPQLILPHTWDRLSKWEWAEVVAVEHPEAEHQVAPMEKV